MYLQEVIQRLYALDKKVRQKQILYSATALTGTVGCCHILGVDYTTGDLYYKDSSGNWALEASGGGASFPPQTGLSGNILYTNGTSVFWGAPSGSGLTSLNALSTTTQTFATGTSGTTFGIVSSGSTHTFNIPSSSASNRGLLTAANWTTFNNKQNTISLTTLGSNGVSTFDGTTLNIPLYSLAGLGGITLTSLSGTAPVSYNNTTGVFSMAAATTSANGYLTSTNWNTFNNKQAAITFSTTGSSGAATFVSNTLNIPTYTLAGLGGISLSSLSATSPIFYNNTTGVISSQAATASVNGYLTSANFTTFNNKQTALVSGTNIKTINSTSLLGSGDIVINSSITSKDTFIVDGTGNQVYSITAGYLLDKIIIIPTSNCNPYCSFTTGTAGDIIPQDLVTPTTAAIGSVWALNQLAVTTTSITVSSMAVGSTIVFIKTNII